MSEDFAGMDDFTLIRKRQEMRARLERLPPHSAGHGYLQAVYDRSTEVIDDRARAAWTGGLAMAGTPETGTADVSAAGPGSGWPAVAAAVRQRMRALNITTAGLARDTGVCEATIRSIRARTASPRPATLARLSKGLGWPDGFLEDIAAGSAQLPADDLNAGDVITRAHALLARVGSERDTLNRELDTLIRALDSLAGKLAALVPGARERDGHGD